MLKNQILKCRVCGTNKSLQKFSFDHLAFLFKDKNWDSVYCFECDCISEYINNENDNNHIYSDGSYRSKNILIYRLSHLLIFGQLLQLKSRKNF